MKRVAAILVAVGLFAGTFSSNTAVAADKPQAEVRVRVIQATNSGKKFDPHLEDLRKFLGQHKFSSFKQVIDETIEVGEAETKGIGLLSGKNLNVTLKSLTKEKATIQLLLLGQTGQILDTTVAAGPHKLFFIAGPKYEDGVLFIAIEPHYDPETLGKMDVGSKSPH
jgi:hypothetical protein